MPMDLAAYNCVLDVCVSSGAPVFLLIMIAAESEEQEEEEEKHEEEEEEEEEEQEREEEKKRGCSQDHFPTPTLSDPGSEKTILQDRKTLFLSAGDLLKGGLNKDFFKLPSKS